MIQASSDSTWRFYGWVVVIAGIIVTCIGMGTMMSLGVFMQPMAADMGWSRTDISLGAVISFLSMGLAAFFWGSLSDRYGTRVVVLAGGVLQGLGCIAASQAHSLTMFMLTFGVMVGFGAGSFYAPLMAVTARWFTRHRSLAVALVAAGLGLGSSVISPLAGVIIANYGWRTAMLVIGLLAWGLIIPAGLLIRRPPAEPVAAPKPGAPPAFTVGQAMRTPQFAAITFTHFACCAAHSGPIFHMVSYAVDCGISAITAATVFSAAGLASLSGRVLCGLAADRIGAKTILIYGLALQAVAVLLYLFTREPASFYALAMIFGFSYGGVMPLYAIVVRDYFGPAIMGSVFGAVAMASTVGMAIGPWAGGMLYDQSGSYGWMFVGSAAIGVGALAMAWTFRPPQPPALLAPAIA